MATLSDSEINSALREVSGWQLKEKTIAKTYTFPSFPDAISFVNRIAQTAEEADHHPDILVSYRRVTLTYSTHSEGGLTRKDFEGAKAADRLATAR